MPQKPDAAVLAALSGVPFIMVLGNSMIIPVLPDIKKALELSDFNVSMIITLFSVPAGIIIPLAGFLSDRFGRKVVIIPSLVMYGLGGIVAGLAALFLNQSAFPVILVGRIMQGIGAAGTAPIAMALCGDLFTGKDRSKSLGIIEAANGLGKVISPVLGSLVGLIAWFATFLLFPVLIIPVVLGIWLLVKDPLAQKGSDQKIGAYLKSIGAIFSKKTSILLASFFSGMTALLLLFGVLFFLSDYLESRYGLRGVKKGLALAIPVLFMSSTSYITGMLIKRKVSLIKWLVFTGMVLITVALALLGMFNRSTYLFFAAVSVAGIGTGLALPCLNTIITSSCEAKKRGMITSLYGSVRFFGVAIGPPAFGLLMGYSRGVMFWSAAALAGTAALAALFFIRVSDMKQAGKAQENRQGGGVQVRSVPLTIKAPAFVFQPSRKPSSPEPKKDQKDGDLPNRGKGTDLGKQQK